MPGHDIIVIGASAGGLEAVSDLVTNLPADLPAALFVVLHTAPSGPGLIPTILGRLTPLRIRSAEDPVEIKHGTIYVAEPDHHLLLKEGFIRSIRGPHENQMRPAIDPLFRTAAVAYGSRVIGILMSGYLDDGVSGLLAIKRCQGIAIVQDPDEARVPEMPRNAIEKVAIDHVLPVRQIAALLPGLVESPAPQPVPVPEDIRAEAQLAEMGAGTIEMAEHMGALAPFSCPVCGGPLWLIEKDKVSRYRCHVGHSYTGKYLLGAQSDDLEQALWGAIRLMEEHTKLLEQLADSETQDAMAEIYRERAREARQRAEVIREFLVHNGVQVVDS